MFHLYLMILFSVNFLAIKSRKLLNNKFNKVQDQGLLLVMMVKF